MHKYSIFPFLFLLLLAGCKSSLQTPDTSNKWFNIAVADGVEIYVDTASIKPSEAVSYAYEKRVYTTPEAKKAYIDKIRNEYSKMGKPEKADKWNDFSYNIYYSLYDCTNQRFKVLMVEDYDSAGNRIIRTKPAKSKEQWLNVENETVGDYTFFFICDYNN